MRSYKSLLMVFALAVCTVAASVDGYGADPPTHQDDPLIVLTLNPSGVDIIVEAEKSDQSIGHQATDSDAAQTAVNEVSFVSYLKTHGDHPVDRLRRSYCAAELVYIGDQDRPVWDHTLRSKLSAKLEPTNIKGLSIDGPFLLLQHLTSICLESI